MVRARFGACARCLLLASLAFTISTIGVALTFHGASEAAKAIWILLFGAGALLLGLQLVGRVRRRSVDTIF